MRFLSLNTLIILNKIKKKINTLFALSIIIILDKVFSFRIEFLMKQSSQEYRKDPVVCNQNVFLYYLLWTKFIFQIKYFSFVG